MTKRLEDFVEALAQTEVTPNVYNPYSYEYEESYIRRENLLIYLKKMIELQPNIMLVGEAPGYRGCKSTGVPFSSEHMLMNSLEGLSIFGREHGYRLFEEKDKLRKEATATIIWNTLLEEQIMSLSWNAFPFHPHKKDNLESNRTPLKKELLIGKTALLEMIDIFKIKHIVAVGNKAEESLNSLEIPCTKVRHPAQGGKNKFVEGIKALDFKNK